MAESSPSHATAALATSSQCFEPFLKNGVSELLQTREIAGYRVVLVPAPNHTLQPGSDLRYVCMESLGQLLSNFGQLGLEFLPRRLAKDLEVSFPGSATDVREAQKVERVGRAFSPSFAFGLCESPEFDQAGLLGMQCQAELSKPLLQVHQTFSGVRFLSEANHKVVRITDDRDFASGLLPPGHDPQVEDVVQEHVG